jgi:hypothetical protein
MSAGLRPDRHCRVNMSSPSPNKAMLLLRAVLGRRIRRGRRCWCWYIDVKQSGLFPGRFSAQVFLSGSVNADDFAVGDE